MYTVKIYFYPFPRIFLLFIALGINLAAIKSWFSVSLSNAGLHAKIDIKTMMMILKHNTTVI